MANSARAPWPNNDDFPIEPLARAILSEVDKLEAILSVCLDEGIEKQNLVIYDHLYPTIKARFFSIERISGEIIDYGHGGSSKPPIWYASTKKIAKSATLALEQTKEMKRYIDKSWWIVVGEITTKLLELVRQIRQLVLSAPFKRKGSNGGNSGSTPKGYLVQGWPVSVGKRTM